MKLIVGCVAAVVLAVAILLGAFLVRKDAIDQADHSVCVAIRNIDVVVTEQLRRSRHNLSKLAYFREHPDELRDQVDSIDRQLIAFRPRECR